MKELSYQDYEQIRNGQSAIVEFYAPSCAHCRQTEAFLEELSREQTSELLFGKVDITKEGELAEELEIMSVPTMLFLKNGQVIEKLIGEQHKLILAETIKKL